MTTVVLAFSVMLLLVAAMAVGVIFGRKPITGSCGGMKALGLNMECEICGGDPSNVIPECLNRIAGVARWDANCPVAEQAPLKWQLEFTSAGRSALSTHISKCSSNSA